MTNRLEKQTIVDTYQIVLNEYFLKFLESDICRIEQNFCVNDNGGFINFDNHINSTLFTGISTINRVFEYVFLKTKHISSAYYYSNEAFSYYLEYMEQIYKAGLLYNINHADAILFVYKKTIFEMFENNNTTTVELGGRSIFSNIIESNKEANNAFQISDKDFKDIFLLLSKTAHLLLCWKEPFLENLPSSLNGRAPFKVENPRSAEGSLTFKVEYQRSAEGSLTIKVENPRSAEGSLTEVVTIPESSFIQRIEFCQHFLENFMKNIDKIGWKIECLEIMHQRLTWTNRSWKLFLEELIADVTKRNRKKLDNNMTGFLLSFNMEKLSLQEKINKEDIQSILKWYTSIVP